jgi:hypothetical protein
MNKFILLFMILLVGCASNPSASTSSFNSQSNISTDGTQTLTLDRQVQGMSRNEVIMAVQECETSGLRAVVLTTKRRINGFNSDIIFDVTCAPKYRAY